MRAEATFLKDREHAKESRNGQKRSWGKSERTRRQKDK